MKSLRTHFPPRFNINSKNEKEFPKQIRAALEELGCFALICEESNRFSDEMMVEMEKLFSVNSETKAKTARLDSYYGSISTYMPPNRLLPYYEGFSVVATDGEAKRFTDCVWPDGNEKFYRTLSSTNKYLHELAKNIMDIVASSYGLDNKDNSRFPIANSSCKMMRYTPPNEKEIGIGMLAHVDASYITIICQNEVNGLKIKSKDGEWFDVNLDKGSFLVIVGEYLKAWSNGNLIAPVHKVMIGGDRDRYTHSFFLRPEGNEVVSPRIEFLDNENPARFRPFIAKDFFTYLNVHHFREGTLEKFAGTDLDNL